MKNRRDFLKFLGIGAGACVAAGLAVVAGGGSAPATPPRSLPEIERVKTYEGPDGFPGGDYIKRKPDIIRDIGISIPEVPPISPGINVFPDVDLTPMVDNVFRTDPMFQYLTTTGPTTDGTVTVNNDDFSGNAIVYPTPDMTVWTTSWASMTSPMTHFGELTA